MKFDTRKIIEDADARDVAEAIGMRIVKRGSSTFVECPEHTKNTGRHDKACNKCIISTKGYYCFSCGAKGDALKMTREFLNLSFVEACKTVCGIIGRVEDYLEDTKGQKVNPIPYSIKQLEALGLCMTSRAILPIALCESEEELQENRLVFLPKQFVPAFAYVEDDSLHLCRMEEIPETVYAYPTYVGCQKVVYSLNTLYQEEPNVFHELIRNKACEMYWKWKEMLDSGLANKLLPSETAYHVNMKYKNWMGICQRIFEAAA